ncbi:MAG TPA: hypothetical protein EYN06_02965 [Myxococcales bacterium]|nr:hypothetical protein [Myxococcales bacterium]HIN85416.1 hypothetical protein [Myxococcales bacterium]
MKVIAIAVLILTAVSCYRSAPLVDNASAAQKLVGKTVRVTGTLNNTKLAPSVQTNRWTVYCLDMPWPNTSKSGTVTVEGQLEYTQRFQAGVSDDGAISQGTDTSGDWVLNKCAMVTP